MDEDMTAREEALWLRHMAEVRERPPAEHWLPQILLFLAVLAVVDTATFYGLYLLGALLHRVIFG